MRVSSRPRPRPPAPTPARYPLPTSSSTLDIIVFLPLRRHGSIGTRERLRDRLDPRQPSDDRVHRIGRAHHRQSTTVTIASSEMAAAACQRSPPPPEAARASSAAISYISSVTSSPLAAWQLVSTSGGTSSSLHTIIVHPVSSVQSARANRCSPPTPRAPPAGSAAFPVVLSAATPPSSASVDAQLIGGAPTSHLVVIIISDGQLALSSSRSPAHAPQPTFGSCHLSPWLATQLASQLAAAPRSTTAWLHTTSAHRLGSPPLGSSAILLALLSSLCGLVTSTLERGGYISSVRAR